MDPPDMPCRQPGGAGDWSDLAIIAALIFVRGTVPARLEGFDMTAPIVFTARVCC